MTVVRMEPASPHGLARRITGATATSFTVPPAHLRASIVPQTGHSAQSNSPPPEWLLSTLSGCVLPPFWAPVASGESMAGGGCMLGIVAGAAAGDLVGGVPFPALSMPRGRLLGARGWHSRERKKVLCLRREGRQEVNVGAMYRKRVPTYHCNGKDKHGSTSRTVDDERQTSRNNFWNSCYLKVNV